MGSDWREVSLGDVAGFITGYPFKSQYYTDNAAAPRLIGGDNISQGNLRWKNIRRWPHDMTNGLDDYWLEPGDVVLAMDRPWIEAGLKRAAVGEQDVPSLLVQRTARLRGTNELDTAFLRYVVSSQAFTQYILSVQTGTAVPHISPTQIRAFGFRLPPIEEQRAIAHILGTLDDKIELNRKQNETLEAMARALFKAWFVDFEPVRAKMEGRWQRGQSLPGLPAHLYDIFPDNLVDSERGEVPEAWCVLSFGDVARQGKGAVNPSLKPDEKFSHYSLPAFDAGRMPVIELGGAIKSNKTPVADGAVLVSKLNPHIPRIWMIGDAADDAVCSTEFIVWTPRAPANSAFVYCLASSQEFIGAMSQLVTGTSNSHQRVKPGQMDELRVFAAGDCVIQAFSELVKPMMDQVLQHRCQSGSIAQLRDTLLPKLISGELRVPDAERLMDGVLS